MRPTQCLLRLGCFNCYFLIPIISRNFLITPSMALNGYLIIFNKNYKACFNAIAFTYQHRLITYNSF